MSTLPSPRTWLVSTAFSNVTHASGSRNNMVPIFESPLVFPLTFMVLKEKELPLWKEDMLLSDDGTDYEAVGHKSVRNVMKVCEE